MRFKYGGEVLPFSISKEAAGFGVSYGVYLIIMYIIVMHYNDIHALIEGSSFHNSYLLILASSAAILIQLIGVSVNQQGVDLHTQFHSIEVANHCDGLLALLFLIVSIACFSLVKLSDRLRGIIMAIIVMFTLNVIRIAHILWSGYYGSDTVTKMHETIWPVIYIAFAFYIFCIWVYKGTDLFQGQT